MSLAPPLPITRSVSVPGAADSGIEQSLSEQHSFFSPLGESPTDVSSTTPSQSSVVGEDQPAAASHAVDADDGPHPITHTSAPIPIPSSQVGHSHHTTAHHHTSASVGTPNSYLDQGQTPTDLNSEFAASTLLHGMDDGIIVGERRNSKPNLRLQSQAPPKLASTVLAVPSSTLFAPPSPSTPMLFAVPPNTPYQMGNLELLAGEPVTPAFDVPFTPIPVPPSPMLPQAPPSSPYPFSLSSATNSHSPSPVPGTSPHPVREIMQLPQVIGGEDILSPKQSDEEVPPELPSPPPEDPEEEAAATRQEEAPLQVAVEETKEDILPIDEMNQFVAAADEEVEDKANRVINAENTLDVEVPIEALGSDASSPQKLILHRSRLGRLSIIHRDNLKASGLLQSPTAVSSATNIPSPTAIADGQFTEAEMVEHSRLHGPIVTTVQRLQHVTFDPNADDGASLQNIPPEWREALKHQFGIPATLCQSVKLGGYSSRIPLILVRMHEYLLKHKSFETQVGIFRLAPDANECTRLKGLLNTNINNLETVTGISDMANCVANLIKVWFRDLPVALFQPIPPESISAFNNNTQSNELEAVLTTYLKEPHQSIFRWLLDLCCDITKYSDVNKMISKNVAICISPNLYKPPQIKSVAPAEALAIMNQCKYYSNFLEICIGIRELQRGQKKTSGV